MFEGSEKKLEIVFSNTIPSLRSYDDKFWDSVIRACGATIVSKTKFKYLDSYILSESSLFVWDHRLVLITCGQTNLAKSLLKILKHIHVNDIEQAFFQRKNEFFPRDQKSHFFKDMDLISKKLDGTIYQFGNLHDRHCFLFCSDSDYQPSSEDSTLEVLMYDSHLIKNTSKEVIQNLQTQLEKILPGFAVEVHYFEPEGCSINAVRDNFYYTIHVTPQKSFFYTSFETNFDQCNSTSFIDKIVQSFQSNDFDLILFQNNNKEVLNYTNTNYARTSFFHQSLPSGYQVSYMNLQKNEAQKQPAKIIGENK